MEVITKVKYEYKGLTVPERLGLFVKETKEKFGFTQRSLGERIGIGHTSVNQMESGHIDPLSTRVMIKPHQALASIWGWSFDQLIHFYETGEKPEEQKVLRPPDRIIQDIKELGDRDAAIAIATEALLMSKYFFFRRQPELDDNPPGITDTNSDSLDGVSNVGRVVGLVREKILEKHHAIESGVEAFVALLDQTGDTVSDKEAIKQDLKNRILNNTEIPRSRFGIVARILSIWEGRTMDALELEQYRATHCDTHHNGVEI